MLGVPIQDASVLLGDNQSVITSCSIPSSNLKKKYNSIAYHRIREAVAAGIIKLKYVKSQWNLADALTKALTTWTCALCFMESIFTQTLTGKRGVSARKSDR